MVEFDSKVIDIIQRTPSVKSFRFLPEKGADYKAGQFMLVTIKVDGKEESKYLSFSSSPTEKGYVEFTKRITGSPFSKTLNNLSAGDTVHLKMPFGSFMLNEESKKIAFLSGGVGITPIRSIFKFVADERMDTDIVLLYSNRNENEIIFKDDLDRITGENNNLRVIYTLTAPDINKANWHGKTCYIDDAMVKEDIPDYNERIFYVCGPPKMVEYMTEDILKGKLGLPKEKIKFENFVGY